MGSDLSRTGCLASGARTGAVTRALGALLATRAFGDVFGSDIALCFFSLSLPIQNGPAFNACAAHFDAMEASNFEEKPAALTR